MFIFVRERFNQPEREADHSPPSSAEVKDASSWRCTWLRPGTTLPFTFYDVACSRLQMPSVKKVCEFVSRVKKRARTDGSANLVVPG
jgi:hypothetical protein